jgi:hypothetical protein
VIWVSKYQCYHIDTSIIIPGTNWIFAQKMLYRSSSNPSHMLKNEIQSNVYSMTTRMITPFHYIIRSIFYSVFCSVPHFSKHLEVCVYIQNLSHVFLPFQRLSGENNYCNLLISTRSWIFLRVIFLYLPMEIMVQPL